MEVFDSNKVSSRPESLYDWMQEDRARRHPRKAASSFSALTARLRFLVTNAEGGLAAAFLTHINQLVKDGRLAIQCL